MRSPRCRSTGRGVRASDPDLDRRRARLPAGRRAISAAVAAGRHHVVDDGDVCGRAARRGARGSTANAPRTLAARSASGSASRCGVSRAGAAGAPAPATRSSRRRDAARQLPGLVVAALAQRARAAAAPAAAASVASACSAPTMASANDGSEIERAMELERRSSGPTAAGSRPPRAAASKAARRQARAADRTAHGQLQGAAAAARHRRGEAVEAAGADRGRGPSRGRRRTGSGRATRSHGSAASDQRVASIGSIYCRAMASSRIRQRRVASIDVAARAALGRLASRRRAALAARRGRASPGRAARGRCAPTPRRIVEWWAGAGGGDDVAAHRLSARRSASRSRPTPRGRHASRARARRPWWSLGAAGAIVVDEVVRCDDDDRPRPAGLGQHGAHARRRPAGAVRALARAARGRRHAAVLVSRAGHACASCASLYRAAALAGADARLRRHARPRRHARSHAGFADPVLDQETITLRWRSAASACWPSCASSAATPRPIASPACARRAWQQAPASRRSTTRADADGSIGPQRRESPTATASSRAPRLLRRRAGRRLRSTKCAPMVRRLRSSS